MRNLKKKTTYLLIITYSTICFSFFFRFSKSIQAASLAESGESYTYGIATGWGDTRKGGQISNVLLEVRVRIWSNSDCSNRYRSIDNYVTENMLCAGEPGKDTCQVFFFS